MWNSVLRPREMLIWSKTALPSINVPACKSGHRKTGRAAKTCTSWTSRTRYGRRVTGLGWSMGGRDERLSTPHVTVRDLPCSPPNEEQATAINSFRCHSPVAACRKCKCTFPVCWKHGGKDWGLSMMPSRVCIVNERDFMSSTWPRWVGEACETITGGRA